MLGGCVAVLAIWMGVPLLRLVAMLPCFPVAWVHDVVELALRHGCRIGSVGRLFLFLVACFLKGGASGTGREMRIWRHVTQTPGDSGGSMR